MKRALILAGSLFLMVGLLAPVALAADPLEHTGRVLVSTQGDVSLPAGEHADVLVVVDGNAEIRGEVNTLVVVDGSASLVGATIETFVAVRSQVEIGSGTVVYGEVQRFDAVVHQTGNPQLQGGIVDLRERLPDIGRFLGPVLIMLWLGFALSTIVAGLLLAALAARQVRAATQLISREPVLTGATGLVATVAIPVGAILLFPTLIGAPLGFGILFVALPLVAFGGYLVTATWVGDWLIRRLAGVAKERERPYLAVVVGVVSLGAIGLVPVLGILVAIATLFGFGAVIVLGLRTITTGSRPAAGTAQPMPAATAA